jgi:hypothetical protein
MFAYKGGPSRLPAPRQTKGPRGPLRVVLGGAAFAADDS